ncbi:MAG: exo-alpha-sialidase [Acidobacteria bacterium]|nr:exo-alpha-sialidase [Acidobacteriota bacterium]
MTRQAVATAILAVAVSSCARPAPPAAGSGDTPPVAVRLAVVGAVNAMPSVAVNGERVVVVWTARTDEAMDVYAAVSEDNGVTFSPPTRVNDQDGDVSSNAEQPPRAAIAGSHVVVIWPSKKSGESAIRMARSTGSGRTFGPAVTAHSSTLQGARGWESIAAGADGAVHVVWLDGWDAERMPDEDANTRHSSEGQNHAAMKHSALDHAAMKAAPRQDVCQAVIGIDGSISEAHVARDVCFCCKTAVAIGPSGRVNVAWRHISPGACATSQWRPRPTAGTGSASSRGSAKTRGN